MRVNGEARVYLLQQTFEFTSERKKMTTIVRKQNANEYLVLIKGADSTVLPFCNCQNDEGLKEQTIEYTDAYAREGLRTLVFA